MAFRSVSTPVTFTGGFTFTPALPPTVGTGDLLLMVYSGTSATFSLPSGWTMFRQTNAGTSIGQAWVAWAPAGTASGTVTAGSFVSGSCCIAAFTNRSSATMDGSVSLVVDANTTTTISDLISFDFWDVLTVVQEMTNTGAPRTVTPANEVRVLSSTVSPISSVGTVYITPAELNGTRPHVITNDAFVERFIAQIFLPRATGTLGLAKYYSTPFAGATSKSISSVNYYAGQSMVLVSAIATAGTLTPSSDIAGLTWTLQTTSATSGSGNIKVWTATPSGTGTVATVTLTSTAAANGGFWLICTDTSASVGAFSTGTVTAGPSTAFSQSFTPASTGSALYMATFDGNGASTPNITAGTDCYVTTTDFSSGNGAWSMLEPVTNPLTSASAFSLAATTTTEPTVANPLVWVAFEIRGTTAAFTTHTTSGALVGPGSSVVGSANRVDLMRYADGFSIGGNVAVGRLLQTTGTVHGTSGALTGQGSAVAGTATRFRTFATSGALTGQGSSIAGTAFHSSLHATSGSLTGQIGSIAGVAAHVAVHATSGALTGPGSAVAGTAARFRAFSTSGTLTGQGSTIVGTAARSAGATTHATSGALTGQGSAIAGTAARFRSFDTSGVLAGQGAIIAGVAAHIAIHGTSGTLTGPGSAVAGTATRFRAFSSSGALTGQGSTVVGAAARGAGPVTHATSGALTGPGSAVAGTALRYRVFDSTGALTGQGSSVAGVAARLRQFDTSGSLVGQIGSVAGTAQHNIPHPTSGALTGQIGSIAGTAARSRAHATSGALVGAGAIIAGVAARSSASGYPDPSVVKKGVVYGPGGIYTGTLVATQLFVFDD